MLVYKNVRLSDLCMPAGYIFSPSPSSSPFVCGLTSSSLMPKDLNISSKICSS